MYVLPLTSSQLTKSLLQLYTAEHKIRTAVFTMLASNHNKFGCEACNKETAINIALCHAIGFGTKIDQQKASEMARSQKITIAELQILKEMAIGSPEVYSNVNI